MVITYISENGYKGVLYGESSLSIYDREGKEKLHTGSRSIHTYDELKEQVENFPSFLKALSSITEDDLDNGDNMI